MNKQLHKSINKFRYNRCGGSRSVLRRQILRQNLQLRAFPVAEDTALRERARDVPIPIAATTPIQTAVDTADEFDEVSSSLARRCGNVVRRFSRSRNAVLSALWLLLPAGSPLSFPVISASAVPQTLTSSAGTSRVSLPWT